MIRAFYKKRSLAPRMSINLANRVSMAGLSMLLLISVGCGPTSSTGDSGPTRRPAVATMKPDPNVIEIGTFYSRFQHWIWNKDQSKVIGTWVSALYLYGNEGKGVFGEGVIRPRAYLLSNNGDGEVKPQLIKEWAFDVEDAKPFRVKKPSIQGYAYMLLLEWGDELDLTGERIGIIIAFERTDGRIISSRRQDFTPIPAGRQ